MPALQPPHSILKKSDKAAALPALLSVAALKLTQNICFLTEYWTKIALDEHHHVSQRMGFLT